MEIKKKFDATSGPILKNLILFAIPLAIGSLVSSLFSAADMMVLGNFADSTAVASIGATGTILSLITLFVVSLTVGTNVELAQALGEKNAQKTRVVTDTSLILALSFGVVVTVLGCFTTDALLILTKCPDECLNDASLYLKIIFVAQIPRLFASFASSVVIISGDTKGPLVISIIMGGVNVALNFIFCLIMPNKVLAVAIATFISQTLGALLYVRALTKLNCDSRVNFRKLYFSISSFKKILFIGLPCAITTTMFSVSDLILQPVLNSFGPSAIAGNSAANSIGNLIYAFCAAIGSAMVTYMGQNIGAKNIKRVRNSFLHSVWLAALIASSGFIVYIFGRPLLSLYLPDDPAAIEAGILKMKYSLLFFIILQLNPILSNAIQTFGHSIITMINSIISVFIFRFVWVYLIFPQFGTLENYFLSFLVSEILQFIISVFAFWIVYKIQKKKLINDISEKAVI